MSTILALSWAQILKSSSDAWILIANMYWTKKIQWNNNRETRKAMGQIAEPVCSKSWDWLKQFHNQVLQRMTVILIITHVESLNTSV